MKKVYTGFHMEPVSLIASPNLLAASGEANNSMKLQSIEVTPYSEEGPFDVEFGEIEL